MRRDAPDRRAIAFRDEQLRAGMAEEGVAVGIDQLELLGAQLRDAVRNGLRKAAPKIDEFGATALARDRTDTYFACHYTVTPRSALVRPCGGRRGFVKRPAFLCFARPKCGNGRF